MNRLIILANACITTALGAKADSLTVHRHEGRPLRQAVPAVGYCLYNYKYSNNLMLGIGCRLGKQQRK